MPLLVGWCSLSVPLRDGCVHHVFLFVIQVLILVRYAIHVWGIIFVEPCVPQYFGLDERPLSHGAQVSVLSDDAPDVGTSLSVIVT